MVFSLAYLALTTLCSVLFRQPAISLVVNIFVLFAIWLLAAFGEYFDFAEPLDPSTVTLPRPVSSLAYLRYGSVWHYASDLLHPGMKQLAIASLAHLGFCALFLGSAHLVLRRRDL